MGRRELFESYANENWFDSIFGEDDPQDHPEASSKPRIQRVPFRIHDCSLNPRLLCLGPCERDRIYYDDQMEKRRKRAAKRFVDESTVEQDKTQVRKRFHKEVMEVIGVAKECYSEEVVADLTDYAFAKIMFLDGCFVLYFIQGMNKRDINLGLSNDEIPLFLLDMFLLENQLPFEVLDALMRSKFGSSSKLKEEILEFINWNVLVPMGMFYPTGSSKSVVWRKNSKPLHLLDILQTILLDFPPSKLAEEHSDRPRNFGSVMELKDAGIRFEKSDSRCLMGVRFDENFLFTRLLLPPMFINDTTESLLLSLTAFEISSDTHSGCGVSSYINFLNSLIKDASDVQELRSKGILRTLSSNEEVVRLFNEWPIQATKHLKLYSDLSIRIRRHRENRAKTSIARWSDTYFGNTWIAVSSLAAFLLLIFTLIQTVCTIITTVRS